MKILGYLAIIFLLVSPFENLWPYYSSMDLGAGFYTFLRWFIFITAIFYFYVFFKIYWNGILNTGFIALVLIYNPIWPLHFQKINWIVWDMLTAFFYYKAMEYYTKQEDKKHKLNF